MVRIEYFYDAEGCHLGREGFKVKRCIGNRPFQMNEIAESAMRIMIAANPEVLFPVQYHKADDLLMKIISEYDRSRLHIRSGEEYFFVYDNKDPDHVLYAVNVTGDSVLTAASELMSLIAKKL